MAGDDSGRGGQGCLGGLGRAFRFYSCDVIRAGGANERGSHDITMPLTPYRAARLEGGGHLTTKAAKDLADRLTKMSK